MKEVVLRASRQIPLKLDRFVRLFYIIMIRSKPYRANPNERLANYEWGLGGYFSEIGEIDILSLSGN